MAARRRPLSVFGPALFAIALAIVASAWPTRARAAVDVAAVNKVTNLNKQALDAYANQDYDSARDLLKKALDLCASAGLDQHPITARTHVHFGVVAIVGFKQRELGLKQFSKALEIQPDIKLTKSLVTPELQDAFEEAVLASNGGGNGGGAAGGDEGNAPPAQANDEGGGDNDDNRPPPRRVKPRRRTSEDDDEKGDKDKDNDDEQGGAQKGHLFFALTLGSSFGIASGSGHLNPAHKLAGPGFALGQLGQAEPQAGYFVTPTVLLSLAARLQYVTGTNGEDGAGCPSGFCSPLTTAGAILARVTFLVTDGPFHFTAGGQIGGGYVVHVLAFPSDTKCGTGANQQCVDSYLGGPFLIGPTVGLMYELGSIADIVAGLDTEIGAPKFTFNFDIDAGIAFRL